MSKDSSQKIQEMQMLEQGLQNILLQKQAFQMDFSETESALKEVESSDGEVFKIVGQMMIKTDREKMKTELSEKAKMFDVRMKTIDKQEKILTDKLEKIREEVMKDMKK